MRSPKFTPIFAPEAVAHLDAIDRKYHGLIARTLDEQLGHTPEEETRNRKLLEQPAPFGADMGTATRSPQPFSSLL